MTRHRSNFERRSYPRISVDILGELRIGSRQTLSCRIRDICQGGLLIECTESEIVQSLQNNTQVFINFTLPLFNNNSNLIQTWIQILPRGDNFFGARFLRLDAKNHAILQAFITAPRTNSTSDTVANELAQTARAILRRITLRCLDDLTKPLSEQMQAILWAASERANNNAERTDIHSDIIRLDRAIKQRRFQEQLRRELLNNLVQINHIDNTATLDKEIDSETLALMDKDGFDLWLAVSALVERLERQLDKNLLPLRSISATVFGNNSILSIEPQGLAQALRSILTSTGITTKSQLLCLRAATKPLPNALATYYQALNEAWNQAGLASQILPKLPSTTLPTSPVQNLHEAVNTKTVSDILATNATIPAPDQSLYQFFTNLLSQQLGSSIQLPPQLDDRVKITDQVLQQVNTDSTLPTAAKHLMQRLSTRFLTAAIECPNFFTATQHPMIDLFNQIEHLSIFLPTKPGDRTQTQRTIEQIMQQVEATNPKNTDILQKLSTQCSQFQHQLTTELQTHIEQLIITCDSQQQIRYARREVRNKLNATFANKPIHQTLANLIHSAWRTLLQLTWIKEQGTGAKWQHYWQILLYLHQACNRNAATITEAQKTELLQAVREGLKITSFDSYHTAMLNEHIQTLLHTIPNISPVEITIFNPIPTPPNDIEEETSLTTTLNAQLAIINELAIGTNLLIQQANAQLRLILVWRSQDNTELAFIDPITFQSQTFSRTNLARAIYNQTATIQQPVAQPLITRSTETMIKQMQERIHYHETHDLLTGLRNRRQFHGALTQIISTIRTNTDFSYHLLGFLDIDKFDALTSTYGYNAGERLLVTIANSLQNLLDTEHPTCLAYLGGSRFGLLLPIIDDTAAIQLGQRLIDGISATPFYWRGTAYSPSVSLGLALITHNADNPETLLSAADTACTTVQRNGGGSVMLFHESNTNISRHQNQMRNWIQAEITLKGQHIRLRGQRIASASTPAESPHHYEILLSVYDEQGKPLPLDSFIAAAEAFNLMLEIDRLVLVKSLEWVHANLEQTKAFGGVAINLSGQSMGDKKLVQTIKNELERLAISPTLISFEVTETTAIANLDQAAAIIAGIKDIGCHFALDDFGAGMSSYTYLKRLPVDYLKIDGSFIKDILNNPNDQMIVKSINDVAHFMGKQTIAEYVENMEILKRLQDIGIDYVQGYAVGKPLFLDEVASL